MLDLLRDAFNHGWRAHFNQEVPPGRTKGIITRVWVSKDAPAAAAPGKLVFKVVRPIVKA